VSDLRNIMGEIAKNRAVKQMRGDTTLGGEEGPFDAMLPQETRGVGRPPIGREEAAEGAIARTGPAERVAEMAERREQPVVPFEPGTPTQARRDMEEGARQFDEGLEAEREMHEAEWGERARQFDLKHALDQERFELEKKLETMTGRAGTGSLPGMDVPMGAMPGDAEISRSVADDILWPGLQTDEIKSYRDFERAFPWEQARDAGVPSGDVERTLKRSYDDLASKRVWQLVEESLQDMPGFVQRHDHPGEQYRFALNHPDHGTTIESLTRGLPSDNPFRVLLDRAEEQDQRGGGF